jgi:hypothetical protein
VPEQFRELEHAAFMADLGGGHQCARELAILSGQIDLADVRASRRPGDGSPLQRLLGHELVVEFRKWREMSGKGKKLRRLGARPTLTASRPSEEFPGVLSASELDSSTSICLACLQGLTVELL